MSATFTTATAVAWLRAFEQAVADNHEWLTELDSAIGDADHGSNMRRGMKAVVEDVDLDDDRAVADLFKDVGRALVSKVGGASGPLYGTFMLKFAAPAEGSEMAADELVTALEGARDGVVARGKAEPGDKTMVDALNPAVEAMTRALEDGDDLPAAARAAADAAAEGRDETEPLVARKGRASYMGERSTGHIDPGAASTALLFEALAGALSDEG